MLQFTNKSVTNPVTGEHQCCNNTVPDRDKRCVLLQFVARGLKSNQHIASHR